MEELIARVTAFIAAHGVWAGPIIGVLTFGESLAFVGLLIPATTLMIAVGGLIGTGTLEGLPIICWAIGGAVVGDSVSYWLGLRIGPSVYRRWPLNRHRPMIARARLFFRRFGFVSIFLGRFLGPVRATIPLVAGVMQMQKRRFQVANIISAIIWVPLLFAPGYLATTSLGPVAQISEMQLLILAVGSMMLTVVATLLGAKILGGNRKRARTRRQALAREILRVEKA